MKVYFISDTHCLHEDLDMSFIERENIRAIFFCGDESSSYELAKNAGEAIRFFSWAKSIKEKYNIPFYYIPGNHSAAVYHNLINPAEYVDLLSFQQYILIDEKEFNIVSSPITPTFGQTKCYMRDRGEEISNYWDTLFGVLDNRSIDILITHGPPYGILDYSQKRIGDIFFPELFAVGCEALIKKVEKHKPKIHAFGHIHDSKDAMNSGKIYNGDTLFINCAAESHFTRKIIDQPGHIVNLEEFV